MRPALSPPACKPASSPRSNTARRAGAALPATVSMAGSNSSGCGVSTPMRRWISFNEPRTRISRRPCESRDPYAAAIDEIDGVYDFLKQQTMVVMGPRVRGDDESALLAQPYDHVDAGDLIAFGHLRHLLQHQMRVRNVDQFVVVFEIEVVMRRHVGVEIGLGAVDADLAQQPCIGQLVEGVVGGCEAQRD